MEPQRRGSLGGFGPEGAVLKSLLIVANLCHASPRIPGFARYLPEYGWAPLIVSPTLSDRQKEIYLFDRGRDLTIVETEGYSTKYGHDSKPGSTAFLARAIRGIWRRIYQRTLYPIIAYPDEEKGWIPYCTATATRIAGSRRFDAIMSSSSPVSCHLAAKRIAGDLQIPWVADLRDPWTQNMAYPFGPIRKTIERRLEISTLRPAAHLVAVTPQCAEQLGELHCNPISCVTNGYDDMYGAGRCTLTQGFTITYAGNIYLKRRDPKKLLRALAELIHEGRVEREDVELRFYGTSRPELMHELEGEKLSLADRIMVFERVSRLESYMRQQESQLLVDFNWEDPAVKGVAPSKFYEYLRARRPILATGGYGGDFVEGVLKSTMAGRYCRTHAQIKEALLEHYLEFKARKAVSYRGIESEIRRYSYRSIAKQLASILDSVVGCPAARGRTA